LGKDQTCKIISPQLLRRATSVKANIMGAQADSSKKDFTVLGRKLRSLGRGGFPKFFAYALKSANESKF